MLRRVALAVALTWGASASWAEPASAPAPAATTSAARAPAATPLFTRTLPNGMQLIVKVDRRAPTAVHMVWVRAGAYDEGEGVSGVAHVLEHMMFKGTQRLQPGEFSRRVAALGGQENAFTTMDYTGYYQQIPKDKLADVMRLEADRFANNRWPDDEFTKELAVVKEERRMRTDDNPRSRLFELVNATSFVANPYHRPVIGWMGDLDSLAPDDVRDFHRRWYVPANAAVVVAGDVNPEQVWQLAQQTYGKIPKRAVPTRKPMPEPEQQGMRRVSLKAPAEQAYVILAFKVPQLTRLDDSADTRDALALTVLSAVLDGYGGARLDRALMQGPDRVADSASTGNGLFGRGPQQFFMMGVPAAGKTAEQVEAALRAEVARVAKEGISEQELARVKTQWTASQVYELDSLMNQARELGAAWVQGLPLDLNPALIAALNRVTAKQVQDVAQRYFGDDGLTVGTLIPVTGAAPARPAPAGPQGELH
ncbi:peptidase M16 [Comamonas serinivorans]|uniref:Peptidase M16 n=1 Tax=Comamonas serinivorans TaxID=1082851 RepID=A0A1Y0EQZ3_9BURK|nr:pitrilysin family protein [Comamonas serinivorans]ARU05672.1 peptidase M16 [Comamonas serinivorans]